MQEAEHVPPVLALPGKGHADMPGTAETFLWAEEHTWLYALLQSHRNESPTFRCPDLISACVTLAMMQPEAIQALFSYLGSKLVLRDPATPRRREAMWRQQYELLQTLQHCPHNRHPNPRFQLDQITTACVALCIESDPTGEAVLRQARQNMAERSLAP